MYSSMDRIDIVTRDEGTGRRSFHQTDHRQAEEILAEEDLSVLFALIRVLNARRMAEPDEPDPEVLYVAFDTPPEALQQAVAAAGGRVVLMDDPIPYRGPKADPVDLADGAFARLAVRVVAEQGVELSAEGLSALEREARAWRPDREEDEIGYFTWMVQLAAVAGELLRAAHGGCWIRDAQGRSLIPFVFRADDDGAIYNLGNKAEKFLTQGERESLTQLLTMAADVAAKGDAPARVMATFKPPAWEGAGETVCRPLLDKAADMGAGVPLVVYGEDLPSSFGIFTRDGQRENDLDGLHAKALENLREVQVEQIDVDLGELTMLVVTGDYYAAEKLLVPDFMRTIHTRLGSELLAAGVPRKGVLMIIDGIVPPQVMAGFMQILQLEHDKDDAGPPICATPLLVQDGQVCGVVRPAGEDEPPPEPPRKKGFFGRLLGR